MKPISDQQIVTRLKLENPWWETGAIPAEQAGMKERPYLDQAYGLMTDFTLRRALVLMGPRRVGKTVMLFHAIARLIKSGVPAKRILYVSVDHPLYNHLTLDDFVAKFKEIASLGPDGGQAYAFFDEIQYMKDWEILLKHLVDDVPNIKFVVSGSAAAALRLKSNESGAGRFTDFLLPPLTFYEFLLLLGEDNLVEITSSGSTFWYEAKNLERLNGLFIEYLNYGGYPELALSETARKDPQRFIKSDIIDKVLLRDLPSLYGIDDIQELNSLFTTLAYNTGNEVSLEELSKNSGVAKNTIKKYIEYLEAAFLIRTVSRIDKNAKRFQRAAAFKVYLTNPSIRAALFAPIQENDEAMGSVVETAVFSQFFHDQGLNLHYARWNAGKADSGEVDIVFLDTKAQAPERVVEVKWSDRYFERPEELKSLVGFCKKHSLSQAVVTTKTGDANKEFMGVELIYLPASAYTYAMGNSIIRKLASRRNLWRPGMEDSPGRIATVGAICRK